MSTSPKWTKPNEVMQLHRLRQKQKALQERMQQPAKSPNSNKVEQCQDDSLDFSILLGSSKRRNPFVKDAENKLKKIKDQALGEKLSESSDRTLFHLLHPNNVSRNIANEFSQPENDKISTFSNLFQKYSSDPGTSDHLLKHMGFDHVPIDWSLKTKLRFMSLKPFAWNHQLKASEEASGITGYVRCLDTSDSSTLDTSYRARFHQHSLYWQHPNLPWIDLFPRSNGKISVPSIISTNDKIKESLHREWTTSFRSLFQLVRTRQCPYFYVCANTFTCLFRAAGICSITEICALLTPTTRGFRQTLKQEDIEFTMPLRKRKSSEFDINDKSKNSSLENSSDHLDEGDIKLPTDKENDKNDESGDDDDLESEKFLQSLGVAEAEIKKINYSQTRINQAKESKIDNVDESLIFIKGVDVNGLFNFLLNCKSCTIPTGPFGGIPPTLLAPTAFQGGTLKSLLMRNSEVVVENKKYYSIELCGPVLPINVHNLCSLFESNSNSFSVTFASFKPTMVFSNVSQQIAEGGSPKETDMNKNPSAFYRENLSDCGMDKSALKHFCSTNWEMVRCLDSLKYCGESKTYLHI